MEKAGILIRDLHYVGSELHVEVHASNGSFAAKVDFYTYADYIRDFGEKLKDFPRAITDEASWEEGSRDPGAYNYFLLRAYVIDGVGHTALEFSCENRSTYPHEASAHFSIPCEASGLNRLGERLVAWADTRPDEIRWET